MDSEFLRLHSGSDRRSLRISADENLVRWSSKGLFPGIVTKTRQLCVCVCVCVNERAFFKSPGNFGLGVTELGG